MRDKLDSWDIFLLKALWTYPLFVTGLVFASSFFVDSLKIRIFLSAILGFFPWRESVRRIYSGSYKHLRTEILVLLQVLTTSVSSGWSLERSLTLVRPVIEHTFGKRSPLIKPLIELENDLRIHMDLRDAMDIFSKNLDFPETAPVFHALAISSAVGSNTLAILRSSCQMISEMNAVRNEINAQNAGKNAEALMLCVMPFAITAALDRMGRGYLETARSSGKGALLLGSAFAIAIIASALLFKFMSNSEGGKAKKGGKDKVSRRKIGNHFLTGIVKRVMPASFISSRHELFSELYPDNEYGYEAYLRRQSLLFLTGLILSLLILSVAGKSLILAIPLALIPVIACMNDVRMEVQIKREDLMRDIPLLLCLICTLLEAGLQIPKAIEICAGAFPENRSLTMEIRNLRAMMLSGISPSDAVEKMSLRIRIPEAQSALLLVGRYGRLGTSEVLNLLSLQASSCWNLTRNAARKKQERESLGLLFPMTLDFLCVLLVATTPAVISLGI